jgi:hypothetical protein
MQILLEITQDQNGRLSGSAGLIPPTAGASPVPFSGTLELLASVEDLCRRCPPTATDDTDRTAPANPRPHSDRSEPAARPAKDPS